MVKFFIIAFFVTSCGIEDKRRTNCTLYGDQCHDEKTNEPLIITGSAGPEGKTGNPGAAGKSGHNIIFSSIDNFACPAGGKTLLIAQDVNANNIIDPLIDLNIQSLDICNGSDGTNGNDGIDAPPSEFTPVEIIDPCNDAPGIYDEVFLRLYNGQLLWSLSDNENGKNTRFSLAVAGSWKTTDGSNCFFSIDNSYNLFNEHY